LISKMCGIVGYAGSFARELLVKANNLQAHRGPDAAGVWFDENGSVGVGHRRLSIIDLSPTGAQPMESQDGATVVVFNGEIYNFRELRSELIEKGYSFRGHSDTEVLLRLYDVYGEDMLSRLNGIFAFGLWDKRTQLLLLARDALGVKPLYYTEHSSGFAFASEIKALLCLVPQARALDIPALHRYLSYLWCPGEGTPLRGVRKLLPGEAISVQAGKIARRWTWYKLPVFRDAKRDLSVVDAVNGTAEGLRRAVNRQLVADVPVGTFLSGGLDSSAVAAFARESASCLPCFTIDVKGSLEPGMADDLPYAQRVAQHLGLPLHVVSIDAQQMATDLEAMIAQLDEPLADPAALNVLYISRLARSGGIKVLLSGAGGDDLFTGYRRHVAAALEHYWSWLPSSARRSLVRATAGLDQRKAFSRRMAKLFSGADLSGDARLANYFNWSKETELLSLYTADFRKCLKQEAAATPMIEFLRPLSKRVPPLERMLALEQRFFLADHNLMYTDKMSMAAGVEVRVPFLDLDLVEHAARIPTATKQRRGVGKWVLKKAMEPYLPSDVIHRTKVGFGAPLRQWMHHDLKSLVGDVLSTKSLATRGLFEPTKVQELIRKNDTGQIDSAYLLLSLMSIEIWCRVYFDRLPQ
jgi:asparagine synthase (glutamine-hydrolysing)